MLSPPSFDLLVHGVINIALRLLDFFGSGFAASHDVECRPCEHGGNRTQVAAIGVAPQPRGFEGNRAAAAKGVSDTRHVAETPPPQFRHNFLQRGGVGSEMLVDNCP